MAAPIGVVVGRIRNVPNTSIRTFLKYQWPKIFGGQPPILPWDRKRKKEEIPKDLPTFADIIAAKNEELQKYERQSVNIGLEHRTSRSTLRKMVRVTPSEDDLEQAARLRQLKIPLEEVKETWIAEYGPIHKKQIAEHYGIFRDLLDNAYFYPVIDLRVCYDYDDELVTPVCTGNIIPPSDARTMPSVEYSAEPDTLWTLVLTNPDGHLTDNDSEYLHWMVGNIPGCDIDKGEVLCDYLQPIPPRGTGYHRHVFILFKQEKHLDFSTHQRSRNCTSLRERSFKLAEFYEEYEDDLMAVGLSFFQSEHDESVKDVYHNVLDMREPAFEYQYEPYYHPPQAMHPKKQPFDRYYDRYRDKKEIAEEVVRMKLDMISPNQPYTPPYKYPIAHVDRTKPSWLQKKLELMHRRREQFKDLPE